jgi:hypothetical protein
VIVVPGNFPIECEHIIHCMMKPPVYNGEEAKPRYLSSEQQEWKRSRCQTTSAAFERRESSFGYEYEYNATKEGSIY